MSDSKKSAILIQNTGKAGLWSWSVCRYVS